MHFFADVPLDECIGAGSGLDSAGIRHKCDVLRRAVADYAGDGSVADLIRWFGGFEMVMAVGGMLRAAERRITILVDGFIMSACILAASKLYPEVLDYALFGHVGDEQGHRRLLEAMDAEPILHSACGWVRVRVPCAPIRSSNRPCGCSMRWIRSKRCKSPNTSDSENVRSSFGCFDSLDAPAFLAIATCSD